MPVVPTVSGRQIQSRGVQSAGLQTFSQPGIGNAFVRAGTEAIDVFGQAKQRANVAMAQDASLSLSQISSDLLNNPETGLLNLKGKNAIGKGQEYTQQFDAQVEQLAMSLPDEQARNAFMQQAQQQRIQFTTQAGRHEIGQINAYEEGQFQATLLNNGKMPQHCMATTPHTYWLISKRSSKLRITALHMAGVTSKSRPRKSSLKKQQQKQLLKMLLEQTIFR